MGKSTLLNTLVPLALAATREHSVALGAGKHTTTSTRLYHLPDAGGWQVVYAPNTSDTATAIAQMAAKKLVRQKRRGRGSSAALNNKYAAQSLLFTAPRYAKSRHLHALLPPTATTIST
jgi:hypothetical protein